MDTRVRLSIDGPIATITNDNPEKHNAFDDDMDVAAVRDPRRARRAHPTCGRSSGAARASRSRRAATSARSATSKVELTHHELMRRGHRGIQQLLDIDAPIIVACKGWAIGGSFQRALLCDIRIAAEGARFRLPEVTYGVIPDTGGVAVAVPDVRPRTSSATWSSPAASCRADEALAHGIVSPRRRRRRARRDGAGDGRADRGSRRRSR